MVFVANLQVSLFFFFCHLSFSSAEKTSNMFRCYCVLFSHLFTPFFTKTVLCLIIINMWSCLYTVQKKLQILEGHNKLTLLAQLLIQSQQLKIPSTKPTDSIASYFLDGFNHWGCCKQKANC